MVDGYNSEILSMEADISIPARQVIRVLEYLKECRGLPEMIRVDKGPEFISQKLEDWCQANKIRWCSSSHVNRCKTVMWSAATAASEENYSMLTCLEP
jgi:hypothetical protein